jgi:lysophospholipase L1-like esterase
MTQTTQRDVELADGARHPWHRYVALGDSFTEGIGDPDPAAPGGHRGWADRLAEELSRGRDDFAYANLAIRGRLLQQIIDEQLEPALDLAPDLVSLSAGGNDLLRPGSDPDALALKLDSAVGSLADSGATVLLFNGPDIGSTPVLAAIRGKVAIYNENLRTIAARHDAIIADMWSLRQLSDTRMWASDRLHFSPLGHHVIAIMALEALNVAHELSPMEPAPLPSRSWRAARAEDFVWAREYFVPWVIRRIRHKSSGDGLSAKRPTAEPVFGLGVPLGSGDGVDAVDHVEPQDPGDPAVTYTERD